MGGSTVESRASARAGWLVVLFVAASLTTAAPGSAGTTAEDANRRLADDLVAMLDDGATAMALAEAALASRADLARALFGDAAGATYDVARGQVALARDLDLILDDATLAESARLRGAADAALRHRLALPGSALGADVRPLLETTRTLLAGSSALDAGSFEERALRAMRLQAEVAGYAAGHPDPWERSPSPSAAARAVMARHGVEATPDNEVALAALDGLAEPLRGALHGVLDAFLAYEGAVRAAYAGADLAALERLRASTMDPLAAPEAASLPTRLRDEWRAAGLDLEPVFPARERLVLQAFRLDAALAATPPATRSLVPPLAAAPALAVVLGDDADDVHAEDAALLVDAGGDDAYRNNAGGSNLLGGACGVGAVGVAAALLDFGGDDDYTSRRSCGARGGGYLGSGLLLDLGGNDAYSAESPEAPEPVVLVPPTPSALAPPWTASSNVVVGFHEPMPTLEPGDELWGAPVVHANPRLGFAVVDPEDAVAFAERARADARVRYAEPDVRVSVTHTPSDPLWDLQWAPPQARFPEAWDVTTGTSAKQVCVIDTGIRHSHRDLVGNYRGGVDLVQNDGDPWDDHGHGTHVSGIVAAGLGNGLDVAGGANVGFLMVKAIPASGTGDFSVVATAIQWCADNGGDILSISLGAALDSTPVREAVRYAWQRGALLVVSSGNEFNYDTVLYPARYPESIAVNCANHHDERCWFSSYGAQSELTAGGEAVLSTYFRSDRDVANLSGTSMSAPLVAAAAALAWGAAPSLTNAELRQLLRDTSRDLGPLGCDEEFGYGLLDARALVDAALAGDRPTLRTEPCLAGALGSNGGAHQGLGLLLDRAGDDRYVGGTGGVNGGAWLGLGLLHDGAGADAYRGGERGVNGGGLLGVGALLDDGSAGDLFAARDLGTNGGAAQGVGFLRSGGGDDRYAAAASGFGQNGGGTNGLGFLHDLGGSDAYDATTTSHPFPGKFGVNGGGQAGVGFLLDEGSGDDVYLARNDGTNGGGRTGAGFLLDGGGADVYEALDWGVNGGGRLGAAGFLLDVGGGSDSYRAEDNAANGGGSNGVGFLYDRGGDDAYEATFRGGNGGAAGSGGVGFLRDLGGADVYRGTEAGVNGGGNTGGVGVLVDEAGDDRYEGTRQGVNGGAFSFGAGGVLLDLAGHDVAVSGGTGTNGGGNGGQGLLLDASGDDRFEATTAGVNGGGVSGVGLLVERRGGDTYLDGEGGAGQDVRAAPKGTVGAQLDLNRPPVVAGTADRTVVRPGGFVQFADGSTDDGLLVGRSWSFGDGATSAQANPRHAYAAEGVYVATLTVTDDAGDARTAAVATITVSRGAPPVLDPLLDVAVDEGTELRFVVGGSDPDGDPLLFTASNLPPGAAFHGPSRTFAWRPQANQQGVYPGLLFAVSDGVFRAERTVTVTVNDVNNRAPSLTVTDGAVGAGADMALSLYAIDPDADPLVVTLEPLPAGATFTRTAANRWQLRWPTTAADVGERTLSFAASDGRLTTSAPVTLTVTPNQPPTVGGAAPARLEAGVPGTFTATGSDPEGGAVRFEWDFDAADGFQAQRVGPQVAHAYPLMGAYTATVRAWDPLGLFAERTFLVTVDDALRLALVLEDADASRVSPLERPTVLVEARDDAGGPVAGATLTLVVTHVPSGRTTATLDAMTDAAGTARVTLPFDSGTDPGFHLPGAHAVTVSAEAPSRAGAPFDDAEHATATLAYTVAP